MNSTIYLIQDHRHREALDLENYATDEETTRKLTRKMIDMGYIHIEQDDDDDVVLHINVDLANLRVTVVYDDYGDIDRVVAYLHKIEPIT